MALAYLFPGQGAAKPGMGRELAESSPAAKDVFDRVDAALGRSLSALCFADDPEPLTLTRNQQPAVLAVSAASLAAWKERHDGDPDMAAGHSLGEYTALYAAGAIGLEEAARLVEKRGELMQEAVPAGEGAMTAIIGLERDAIESACASMREEGLDVWAANHNGGKQTVLSGRAASVDEAARRLSESGPCKAIPLSVSGPFHTPLMQPAADAFRETLERVDWHPTRFPVLSNVDAARHGGPDAIVERLLRQIVSPVLWDECVRAMVESGMDAGVEFEPGRVLTGLVRRIDRSIFLSHASG